MSKLDYIDDFIISSLIGDGCITNNTLVYDHSVKQYDYLSYKRNMIESIYHLKMNEKARKERNTVSTRLYDSEFGKLRIKYYPNDRKDKSLILKDVKDKNLALCLWLCDDAAINKAAIKLCICACNEQEQNYIIEWFRTNFNVTSYIRFEDHGDVKYPFLIFHEYESMVLYTYLRDFIKHLPSMQHKFRNIEKKFLAKYQNLPNELPVTPRALTIQDREYLEYTDEEVIKHYNKFNTIKHTAKFLNCTEQVLRNILNKHNALHPKGYKRTMQTRGL